MHPISLIQVDHDSDLYWQAVAIRRSVLRTPLGLDFTTAELDRECESFHFVAVTDDVADHQQKSVIGCCVAKPIESAERGPKPTAIFKLRQMAFSDEHRGQGTGRRLIEFIEWKLLEIAKDCEETPGKMIIELAARETAAGFYERLDYQRSGSTFIEVKLPHIKMTKTISTK